MIQIYILFVDDFINADLKEYDKYLSGEEKLKMQRYVFQKDRDQYLLTRTLARKVLSKVTGLHFSDLTFEKNQYGKPHLKGYETKIAFSISHTQGVIGFALSNDITHLGIDVENTNRAVDLDVRHEIFIDEELENYSLLPEKFHKNRFFELWTLKESYMKALGKGFSLPPKSFGFVERKNQFIFQENTSESKPGEYRFQLVEVDSTHYMAICMPDKIIKTVYYKVIPNWEFEMFHPRMLHTI